MSNVALVRDHTGTLHMAVSGHFASGVKVTSISTMPDGTLAAVMVVPIKDVTMREQDNVVPFPVPTG